jgi:hypothetical protein
MLSVARDCWSRGSWRSSSPTFSSKRSLFLLCTFITASTSHTLQLTFVQVVQLDALADVFKLSPVEVSQDCRRRVRSCYTGIPLTILPPSQPRRSQAADRVVALERDGRITGVLDDRGNYTHTSPTPQLTRRLLTTCIFNHMASCVLCAVNCHTSRFTGKFICITPDEMESVKQFIRQRGRVSIADLAVESNR